MGSEGARSLAQQRHERIVQHVQARGAARVAELAELLDVSAMTIRRDLDALQDAGALVKVHGGATLQSDHTGHEPGFDAKSLRNTVEKEAIAVAAARMVTPGSTVGVSAGTTTWRLASGLARIPNLTIVTNSVRVAEVFSAHPRPDRQMILSGGIRTPSDALVGPLAVAALRTLHLDALFIGVHGMSTRAGFSTPNTLEADTNRAFLEAAARKIVLADHTKWDVTGLSSFAALGEVDVLVTDRGIAQEALAALGAEIDEIVLADATCSSPHNQHPPHHANNHQGAP